MKACPIACVVILFLLTACKYEQRMPYTPADEEKSDSLEAQREDSLSRLAEDELPMPNSADELFDDFFFNYAANRHLQLERTSFPLSVQKEGKTEIITKKQWKMERFFMNQDYYTLLFDSHHQMELVKDTTVSSVVVEHISLRDNTVRQYQFNRQRGTWMLTQIVDQPLAHNANAQFFSFYQQFVSDSLFQQQSLAQQIEFVGPDPEDDFKLVEGFISPDSWDAFRPDFPVGELYNIVYGHQTPSTPIKIFVIRGIANGLEVEVTFKLRRGRWTVTKLIT